MQRGGRTQVGQKGVLHNGNSKDFCRLYLCVSVAQRRQLHRRDPSRNVFLAAHIARGQQAIVREYKRRFVQHVLGKPWRLRDLFILDLSLERQSQPALPSRSLHLCTYPGAAIAEA